MTDLLAGPRRRLTREYAHWQVQTPQGLKPYRIRWDHFATWVCVVTNKELPDFVTITLSPVFPKPLPEPFVRLGSLEKWELAYYRVVVSADVIGLNLSERLSHCRVNMTWFRCSVCEAVAVIDATENAFWEQLERELELEADLPFSEN